MNKEQFESKANDLLDNLPELFNKAVFSFLQSGTIDLNDYEDDYVLPKLFMSAFLDLAKQQYKPHFSDHKKKNQITQIYFFPLLM